ncbi:MAG TPA: 5-dehydro-4-deoxyglucarate dehydratase [Mycobacteriales bacterium]|jgi:5-dehydro-4-deoxyglucarate dehydratase|nr:5-dehydro-4-deoxyglucarate dehydratase [Mycobacteriales bacterium]
MAGVLSFPLTPFTADGGKVEQEVLAAHIRQQLEWGPSAVFAACGTGEFTALSVPEYADVVRVAVETVGGAVPVYAGVGGGPAIAREFAQVAANAGVDGLLLLPPYLVEAPTAGLLRHIREVAAATDRPVIVYQRANAVLTPEAAVSLLDVETVVGIKDGKGDLELMQRIVTAVRRSGHARAADFRFLNGMPTAELSAQAYAGIGVRPYSSAVATFVPGIASAFHTALENDDQRVLDTLLAEFYLPFAALRSKVPGYAVSLVKAGARQQGLALGGVRPPLIDPTPEHEKELATIIQRGLTALEEVSRVDR